MERVSEIPEDWSVDSPVISRDGSLLYFLRSKTDDWPGLVYRQLYVLDLRAGTEPVALPIDSIYTVSVGIDNASLFLSRRLVKEEGDQIILFQAIQNGADWQLTNITERDGLSASYVSQVKDGSIYFFQHKGQEGAGIYRAQWNGKQFEKPVWQGDVLSPPNTTAFSPCVCPNESQMLLSIFYEQDGEGGRTGIYKVNPAPNGWEKQKIAKLPYGWSISINHETQSLYFTDGEDILRVKPDTMGLSVLCEEH